MKLLVAETNSYITGFFYNLPRDIEVNVKFSGIENFILSTGEFIEKDKHYPLMLQFEFIIPDNLSELDRLCINDALWDLSGRSTNKERGIYGIILDKKEQSMFKHWFRSDEDLNFLSDLIIKSYV